MAIGGGVYFFKQNYSVQPEEKVVLQNTIPITSSQILEPVEQKLNYIHLYPAYGTDPNVNISKVNVIPVFFVAKDQKGIIKTDWKNNIKVVMSKIKIFFEKEFKNKIEISYTTSPITIKGDKNIEDYFIEDIVSEAKEKSQNLVQSNSYNVWMIYFVRDSLNKSVKGNLGAYPSLSGAVQYEFWLDNDAVNSKDPYGLTGSAHEFGHILGIPHPWELPANINSDPNFGNVQGDLMGYSNNGKLEKLYIREDVKKEMGL